MRHVDPLTAASDAVPADPADPHARAQALVEGQLTMLTRLAQIGMTLAEATERWALAAMDGAAAGAGAPEMIGRAPGVDAGLTYSRVARAVRLTLMLQTRLLQDLPALGRAGSLARTQQDQGRRERAHRLVERAIRAEHHDAEAVEQLSDEAWERLRGEDLGDETGGAPFAEVVARICADLGLSPDWGDRTIEAAAGPAPTDPPSPIGGGRWRRAGGPRDPAGHAPASDVPAHARE